MMSKHIVVTFGRANPITQGHEKVFDKVASVAKAVGGEAHVHHEEVGKALRPGAARDERTDLGQHHGNADCQGQ